MVNSDSTQFAKHCPWDSERKYDVDDKARVADEEICPPTRDAIYDTEFSASATELAEKIAIPVPNQDINLEDEQKTPKDFTSYYFLSKDTVEERAADTRILRNARGRDDCLADQAADDAPPLGGTIGARRALAVGDHVRDRNDVQRGRYDLLYVIMLSYAGTDEWVAGLPLDWLGKV